MIKIEGVSKNFLEGDKTHTVLKDLNLDINRGEIIVLLGKSGSGKSTLLNLISGIDVPDSGSIYINEVDITKLSEKERTLIRRNNLGFIFQFFNLIPTLTVKENLLLPLELKEEKDVSEKIQSILSEVKLVNREKTYPDKLSGGEQQRIAIARALVHDPDLILADEPTGNLDYETSLQIIDLLDKVVKQRGKTMIMVTHSKDVIGLADKVYTLKDGKLIELRNGVKI